MFENSAVVVFGALRVNRPCDTKGKFHDCSLCD